MLGSIEKLWLFPVKSLQGQALEHVRVEPDGLAGDRTSALYVSTYGHPRMDKPYRGKEDNRLHLLSRAGEAIDAARERGVEVESRNGERYFDAAAVSIIFDTWIAQAERLCGVPLDPLRFRPNIVVHAAAGFGEAEEALVGRRLRAGTALFEVTATIKRCVTPTYDVHTGVSNPAISRAIAQERENVMGIYATVLRTGELRLGDAVEEAQD